MIPKEDEAGFDPFAEPDPFREEHPEHAIKAVGELIPKDLLRDWEPGDPPRPEPKQMKCDICFKYFAAKATWFHGKWDYPGTCLNCADGNRLPPGFLGESKRPPVREIYCSRCGISRGVEGSSYKNLWKYELTCAHCGEHMTIYARIRRACADCGTDFFVNEDHPRKVCAKCAQKTSASGQW
jgi:hypothetical protein